MANRLTKAQEKKALHKAILSVIGIIIILILLIKVAIPGLINFSLFLANLRGDGNTTTSSSSQSAPSYVMPPIFTTTLTATNSAKITLNGTAQANEQVILYINNNPVDTVDVKKDGTFVFSNETLSPGANTITAKAKSNKTLSAFSQSLNVTFANNAPTLTIDTPHDGDHIGDATVVVAGKTDPDDKVTVNGFWAIVDSNGQYSYTLTLQNGDNQITVVAQDNAGNQTTKTLKVNH